MQADGKSRRLTPEQELELRTRLELLVYEGRQVEGTSPAVDVNVRPDYFDDERFAAAQKTVNNYFVAISMSSSVGLLLLLQFDEILIPLLKTGKSRSVPELCDRYTATAKYIKGAYETNFLESNSEGCRYISLVRSMHKRTYRLLNSPECKQLKKPSCQATEEGKYVWINQYDMVLTQFAFAGLFLLHPAKCGAYHISDTELSDIAYYWRLMSHQFAIEDRFNLFAYEDLAMELRFLDMLLEHYKEKLAVNRSALGLDMSRGFLLAFEKLTTETTFNILEHHWQSVVSLSGGQQLEPYQGLRERWKLARFTLIVKCLLRSQIATKYMNGMYKKKLDKFCKECEKNKKKLAKKYPNHIYELSSEQKLDLGIE